VSKEYSITPTFGLELLFNNKNKKQMKKTAILLLSVVLLSCERNPFAPAPTANIEYSEQADGLVTLSIKSQNVKNAEWYFHDGSRQNGLSAKYTYSQNGNYTVRASVTGTGGKADVSTSVEVQNVKGSIVFWRPYGSYGTTVTMLGVGSKYINLLYSSVPNCYAEGTATFNLPAGTYAFEAKDDRIIPKRWSGTVEVQSGICRSLQLIEN
jgi:PKD repeat protein